MNLASLLYLDRSTESHYIFVSLGIFFVCLLIKALSRFARFRITLAYFGPNTLYFLSIDTSLVAILSHHIGFDIPYIVTIQSIS